MKIKYIAIIVLLVCFLGCTSIDSNAKVAAAAAITSFSDASGKDLKLVEVQIDSVPFSRKIIYSREELVRERIGDIFTLRFNADSIGGKGAPNQYSAPYTRNNQALEIKTVSSSLMAPIIQPEKIQEQAYFQLLQNAYEWKTENGKMVLLTKTEDGSPARLIFSL